MTISLSRRSLMASSAAVAAVSAGGSVLYGSAQEATPTPDPVGTPSTVPAEVDPQMQEVLDALTAFNAPPLDTVEPFVGRNLPSFKNALDAVIANNGESGLEPVGKIEHTLVPGLDGNDILVRLYHPADAGSDLLPVLVYFHGGGFVIANLDTYDASCRALANAAGCIVASVAYRLAPENPFPAAVDDAYAATQFFLSSAGQFGGDPAKVAVGGESAGGNLATVVSLRARDEGAPMPIHQLLVYPVATFAPEGEAAESVEAFANAMPLNAAALEWFGSYYLSDPTEATNPYVSPLEAEDLSGIPPVTLIQAEIDPLQSQGTVYGDALEAAGVTVSRHFYEGVTHEFFGMGAVVDKAMDAVMQSATELQASFEGVEATPAS